MDVSQVQPLNDRVLVQRIPEVSRSVIALPETGTPKSKKGYVLAVGPGKRTPNGKRIPMEVQVGDLIYFGRYTDYDDGVADILLIQEADIVVIMRDEKAAD